MMLLCVDKQVWKERQSRFCAYRCADERKHRKHPEIKLYQVNDSDQWGKDTRTMQMSMILHK